VGAGRDDHLRDLGGLEAGVGQGGTARERGEIGDVLLLGGDAAGFDAGALADPLVAGLDQLLEVVVRHDLLGAVVPGPDDPGALREGVRGERTGRGGHAVLLTWGDPAILGQAVTLRLDRESAPRRTWICSAICAFMSPTWLTIPITRPLSARRPISRTTVSRVSGSREPKPSSMKRVSICTPPASPMTMSARPSARARETKKVSPPERVSGTRTWSVRRSSTSRSRPVLRAPRAPVSRSSSRSEPENRARRAFA